ncbi:MAG: hypothetical protein SPL30_10925 [Succinivibrio sp.]|nr:hypothetical protein [Succinivibrio sp.]
MNPHPGPHDYDDIISHPRHVSQKHPHMSIADRAAQFLPFDALTGFDEAVDETARLTADGPELGEDTLIRLDEKIQCLLSKGLPSPEIEITVFVPDERKAGGRYLRVRGKVRRLDPIAGELILESGQQLELKKICALEGAVFDEAGL